jgi:hypothetical protein
MLLVVSRRVGTMPNKTRPLFPCALDNPDDKQTQIQSFRRGLVCFIKLPVLETFKLKVSEVIIRNASTRIQNVAGDDLRIFRSS